MERKDFKNGVRFALKHSDVFEYKEYDSQDVLMKGVPITECFRPNKPGQILRMQFMAMGIFFWSREGGIEVKSRTYRYTEFIFIPTQES
jgi:hypothetical protein